MTRQLLRVGALTILCHVCLAISYQRRNAIASFRSPLNDVLSALDIRGGSSGSGGREEECEWEEYDLEEKGDEQEEEIAVVEDNDQEEAVLEAKEESGDEEGDLDDDDHVDLGSSTLDDTNELTIDVDEISDNAEEIDDVSFMQSDLVEDQGEEQSWEALEEPLDDEEEEEGPPFATNAEGESFFNTDDDSSAFIDREELADAYDEAETILGSMRAGGSADDDRVSIDNVPPPGDDEIATATASDELPEVTEQSPLEQENVLEQELVPPESKEEQEQVIADQSPSEPAPTHAHEPVTQDSPDQAEAAAQIPTIIDKATEDILIQDCKYTRSEVSAMKPEIAAVVAQKRLRRPLEGIPPNWIKEGHSPNRSAHLIRIVKNIPKAIIPISLGVLAIYGGREVKNIANVMTSKNGFAFVSPTKLVPEPVPVPEEPPQEEEFTPKAEHLDEVIPRSIKPGELPVAPVDVTILDKAITWVLRRFKAFLRMEI